MTPLSKKLVDAQTYAMSIRPKVGGFPVMAEALRLAGVLTNQWILPACQSVYHLKEGFVVQQGVPLVSGVHEIPTFDEKALIIALRRDQEGKSTFPEFLKSAWEAGVLRYVADFTSRKVSYFGVNGESYVEEYLAVEI